VKEQLLETLEDLLDKELKLFHWYLQDTELLGGFTAIKKSHLEKADRPDTVDLLVRTYTTNAMAVTSLILKKMKREVRQSGEEKNTKVVHAG